MSLLMSETDVCEDVIRSTPDCKKCGAVRERRQYGSGGRKGKYWWYCHSCATTAAREWRGTNPDKARLAALRSVERERQKDVEDPTRIRIRHLRKRYNMTLAQYEEMVDFQNGKCATCGTDSPGGPGNILHVDHDHACCPGQKSCGTCVRGLVCSRCNHALGAVDDRPEVLLSMVRYLERYAGGS